MAAAMVMVMVMVVVAASAIAETLEEGIVYDRDVCICNSGIDKISWKTNKQRMWLVRIKTKLFATNMHGRINAEKSERE